VRSSHSQQEPSMARIRNQVPMVATPALYRWAIPLFWPNWNLTMQTIRVRDCNVYELPNVCDVCFVMLCAWKASVYLSKRINSSSLTKIFNGIGWEGCETQRAIIGWPLLFIVQWVIRNKAWFKHNYETVWCMESPHASPTNIPFQLLLDFFLQVFGPLYSVWLSCDCTESQR